MSIKTTETSKAEKRKNKITKQNATDIQELWDNYRRCNMGIMGIPKEKGIEAIFKAIMSENFPKLTSDTKPQILETQETPSRINAKKQNKALHVGISCSKCRKSMIKKS